MNPRLKACLAAAQALDAALAKELKPIPKDWWTREDFQESKGIKRSAAKEQVSEMLKRGIIETQKWRVKSGWVPIYRVK
jgi:hypothetical protein